MLRFLALAVTIAFPPLAAFAQEAPPPTGAEQPAPTIAPAPIEPPEVELLEPGAEPRQKLRLTPEVGVEQSNRLRLQMEVTVKQGESEPQKSNMPVIMLDMTMKATAVQSEGEIAYALSIANCSIEPEPGMPDGLIRMIDESLSPMNKLTGTGVLTARGVQKDAKFTFPPDLQGDALAAMAGLSDQVSNVGPVLPEEAIGAGAKWQVKTKVRSQGIVVKQTTTYTLTEVRDGVAYLDFAIEQVGDRQEITSPAIPPGMTMEVESLTSNGTGKLELPLNKLVPSRSQAKLKTTFKMNTKHGEQTTSMAQDVELDVTWSPKQVVPPLPASQTPSEDKGNEHKSSQDKPGENAPPAEVPAKSDSPK